MQNPAPVLLLMRGRASPLSSVAWYHENYMVATKHLSVHTAATSALMLFAVLSAIVLLLAPPSDAAQEFVPTCYDDGFSCPGGCDAHVVFDPGHNGTLYAYSPKSTRENPAPCENGKQCTVCFSEEDTDCITAIYRGAGPPPQRFDFTPAFYEEICSAETLPGPLRTKCREMDEQIKTLNTKLNCILNPVHPKCKKIMDEAKARKQADEKLYRECMTLGEKKFNEKYRDRPALQRTFDCGYEKNGTGRNSRGLTWRRLLPAACREGSYVGKNGFDCCSADPFSAACFPEECGMYFQER